MCEPDERADRLSELRELLRRHARGDGVTPLDGVRAWRTVQAAAPATVQPSGTVFALVAEGRKRLAWGDRVHVYGAGEYVVASVDLPVLGHYVDASPARPGFGLGITLEPAAVADLLGELDERAFRTPDAPPPGIAGGAASIELLDAVVRLVRLLDHPRDRPALAPLYRREVLWRLMTGEHGAVVRQLGLADGSLAHIARSVRWIRDNYSERFRVEDLARISGMSVSAFHRNFHAVTAMTPIQFQKLARLQAARLLLANRSTDVTGVGHDVGYDNASQFSREYRRQFGVPPSLDAVRLRNGAPQPAGSGLS